MIGILLIRVNFLGALTSVPQVRARLLIKGGADVRLKDIECMYVNTLPAILCMKERGFQYMI